MGKRRRRTSIRTAAGITQERLLERLRELRDDPLRVLPEPVGPEPAPVVRLRKRLERFRAAGKAGWLARRDTGVLGAVVHSAAAADMETVPRLMDTKVGGQRRFFLPRAQVQRMCLVGVQNHDDPRALLHAFSPMAKKHRMHFFAVPGFWVSAHPPQVPEAWLAGLAERGSFPLEEEAPDRHGCPHRDRARILLRLADGPGVAACTSCAARAAGLHRLVASRYAGPLGATRPLHVQVLLPDGTVQDPDPATVDSYRAGEAGEELLMEEALRAWRGAAREGTAGARFLLGDQDLGDDQEAFLDALDPEPWEREAMKAMTRDGHAGAEASVAAVLEEHKDRILEGVASVLGSGDAAQALVRRNLNLGPRELLRAARDEAERRRRIADLPELAGLGPVGSWVDQTVRTALGESKAAAVDRVRRAMDRDVLPRSHLYAVLHALGGALDLDVRFREDEKQAGRAMARHIEALLAARGDAYTDALRDYLRDTGTGETVG